MVIYLDTSAWLKVYVEEEGRDRVRLAIASARLAASSTIAYAEARAGLSRRWREGDFTREEHGIIVAALDRDWSAFARQPVTDLVAHRAGEVAERFALKGSDAIHLASAILAGEQSSDVRFLTFDQRLRSAATDAGVAVFATS